MNTAKMQRKMTKCSNCDDMALCDYYCVAEHPTKQIKTLCVKCYDDWIKKSISGNYNSPFPFGCS